MVHQKYAKIILLLSCLLLISISCQFVSNLAGFQETIETNEDVREELELEEAVEEPTAPDEPGEEEPIEEPVLEEPVEEIVEEEPVVEEPEIAEPTLLVCLAADNTGMKNGTFNAAAWAGVEAAVDSFGIQAKFLKAQQNSDYEKNINTFIDEGCDLIITVGFQMVDAAASAAEANPDQLFAIVDVNYITFSNLRGSVFIVNEAAFLNGYLAAGMSTTGVVGTYVGMIFPATTMFSDGYALGVEHYNSVHGTDVQVLGWDTAAQEGLATGDFHNLDNGRAFGETLLNEGADIIMPVAGPVGLGTVEAIIEHGSGLLIGVDTDWSLTYPASADFILSSVMKNIDVFVYETIRAVTEDKFESGNWIGNLANDGVGIAYGSYWIDLIPADLLDEITELEADITAGRIQTLP